MRPGFDWHNDKERLNIRKHGISFEEVVAVFDDPLAIAFPDPDHSANEDRFVIIGAVGLHRVLVVVYVERHEITRIISARLATKHERKRYEEGS